VNCVPLSVVSVKVLSRLRPRRTLSERVKHWCAQNWNARDDQPA